MAAYINRSLFVCVCVCRTVRESTSEQCGTHTHQQGPTNICSHITTELITHRCTINDDFNKCNFSKH